MIYTTSGNINVYYYLTMRGMYGAILYGKKTKYFMYKAMSVLSCYTPPLLI